MRTTLLFLLSLLLCACSAALDVMTTQAEWELAQLERCYEAEFVAIEDYPAAMHEVAFLAIKAKYDPAFQMYRAYQSAVNSSDEDAARELFAVFTAMAAGASARCLAAIPQPAESVP